MFTFIYFFLTLRFCMQFDAGFILNGILFHFDFVSSNLSMKVFLPSSDNFTLIEKRVH